MRYPLPAPDGIDVVGAAVGIPDVLETGGVDVQDELEGSMGAAMKTSS
jgi:hypothetical protein